MSPETSAKVTVVVTLQSGDGTPFTKPISLRVRNSRDVEFQQDVSGPEIRLRIPFHDGPGDSYSVIVSADDYRDTGYVFTIHSNVVSEISLLMIRKDHGFHFQPWSDFKADYPDAAAFLTTGSDDATTAQRYSDAARNKPAALASLLNLRQAMSEIDLGGTTPLPFFREILWDNSMQQDRFFGYVDPALVEMVRNDQHFAEEKNCAEFHPGATHSWKQTQFPVTDVQLTFHENEPDTKVINGLKCVKIEPDIDLYKNLVAHGFAEVIPNTVTKGRTDPATVYAMRWTLAADENGPEFEPGYGIA